MLKKHISRDVIKSIIAMFCASGHLIVSALRGWSHDVTDLVEIIVAIQHNQSATILFNWHNIAFDGACNYATLLSAALSDMKGRDIQWVDFSYSSLPQEVAELSGNSADNNRYLSVGIFV